MNNFNIVNASDIISAVTNFSNSSDNEIVTVWNKVVSKIGYKEGVTDSDNNFIGKRLASNSHVVDLKNGVLLVETNHSGWIQYLRMYQNFILKGLKWSLPNLKITSLAFRVRGSEASLSDIYENQLEKAQSKMNEKIDEEEKTLEKKFGSQNEGTEKNIKNSEKLPDELFNILENLKK
jgi:hypothetical protein